jgi:uncharacterized protein (TIGR03086 family)
MVPGSNTGLLEPAIHYALGCLSCITPGALSGPTPCTAWDLATLLEHVSDSLAALCDGLATGRVSLDPRAPTPDSTEDAWVTTIRAQAGQLLAASAVGTADRPVAIADRRLASGIVAAVGAVEIAVHGWDIAESCHCHRPIPAALATQLLRIVPLIVPDPATNVQFAAPVATSADACPSDRLVALLGRHPGNSMAPALSERRLSRPGSASPPPHTRSRRPAPGSGPAQPDPDCPPSARRFAR